MEEITLEEFLRNDCAFDKSVSIKQNGEEVCLALNKEEVLFSLIVPPKEPFSDDLFEKKKPIAHNGGGNK